MQWADYRVYALLSLLPSIYGCDKVATRVERSGAAPLELTAGACGLASPAFCDTFDAPAGTGNRSGQLDGTIWGVSRTLGGGANSGQGWYGAWGITQLQTCNGATTVQPAADVIICGGQLREAVNDLADVVRLAMYPKQPFDFAGRTGIVAFDVSNDTLGSHTQWPELWISDQPVPTPFTHLGDNTAPRNGFGLRFSAATPPFQGGSIAPACPNDAHERWSAGSIVVVRNYVVDDQDVGGATQAQMLDCVTAASGPDQMNHIEVHISQSQIDVYATDAGTTSPLHHIAVVHNANLSFTRGLLWLEDVHYNAGKDGGQAQHTFTWDNFGFDGPALPRDLAFDAPDALQPVPNYPDRVNLGWPSPAGTGKSVSIAGVNGASAAVGAILTLNFHHSSLPQTISYSVNGHAHSASWPYPDGNASAWRTLALPVPLSDVVSGTNTVNVYADQDLTVANVDLILQGAGGGGTATPPGTPGGGTAKPVASVNVSWSASSGASGYNVRRATSQSGPFTVVGSPTTTAFTDTSVTAGTAYWYTVSAYDSAGESAPSAPMEVTP